MKPLILFALFFSGCSFFRETPSIGPDEDASNDIRVADTRDADASSEDVRPDDLANDAVEDASVEDMRFDGMPDADVGGEDMPQSRLANDWRTAFEIVLTYDNANSFVQNTGSGPDDLIDDILNPITIETGKSSLGGYIANATREIPSPSSDYSDLSSGLTIGTWMQIPDGQSLSPKVVQVHDDIDFTGSLLSISPDGEIACWVADGTAEAMIADRAWVAGQWVHVACVTGPSGSAVYVDGQISGSSTRISIGDNSIRFRIGNDPNATPFNGILDDTFVIRRPLSVNEIQRIRSCGIDGKRCTCDEVDPTSYSACGEVCPVGIACNAPLLN